MADPMAAPMMSWAMVPTTISDNAVEMRNQIESRLATNARPSQSAANAHTLVMLVPRDTLGVGALWSEREQD